MIRDLVPKNQPPPTHPDPTQPIIKNGPHACARTLSRVSPASLVSFPLLTHTLI